MYRIRNELAAPACSFPQHSLTIKSSGAEPLFFRFFYSRTATFLTRISYLSLKGLIRSSVPMTLAELIDSRRDQHLAELNEFLRIPSVSAKSEHKPVTERAPRVGDA